MIFKHILYLLLSLINNQIIYCFDLCLLGASSDLGKEIIFALNHMDIPVIMGSTFAIAFLFIIINILVDITHSYLDPRIKYF